MNDARPVDGGRSEDYPDGRGGTPLAHTPNASGVWHTLVDHTVGVVERVSHLLELAGLDTLSYPALVAALFHDGGKATGGFQEYLQTVARDARAHQRGPPHALVGARLLLKQPPSKGTAGKGFLHDNHVAAALVAGHHTGLWDLDTLAERIANQQSTFPFDAAVVAQSVGLAHARVAASVELARMRWALPETALQRELAARMLFSALVDADFLDTEAHFDQERTKARVPHLSIAEVSRVFFDRKDTYLLEKQAGQTTSAAVARMRREVYASCVDRATDEPGLYTLSVPTGGGKTISGLAFALRHAVTHGKRRVIVAAPLRAIIEQTAGDYRALLAPLGPDVVLEHHSGIMDQDSQQEDTVAQRRLWCENWDHPVVVTTMVQLLESLFSNRTGRTRKLHNVARSVVILDEIQSVPASFWRPTLHVLTSLVKDYGVTVVFCSATQPEFLDSVLRSELNGLLPREINVDCERHFAGSRRVRFSFSAEPWKLADAAERMIDHPQYLAVLNTRKDALNLLDALEGYGVEDVYHLSTLLCGQHRRVVVDEVRRRLKAGRPIRLVSTQVIEAGVDVDFPAGLRALAPLESMVQAAGRVNREGRHPDSVMDLVDFADTGMPVGAYRVAASIAKGLLSSDRDLDLSDPQLLRTYFKRFFAELAGATNDLLDEFALQEARRKADFEVVDTKYRLIPDSGHDLIVPWEARREAVEGLIEQAKRPGAPARVLRELQGYAVGVPEVRFAGMAAASLVEQIDGTGLFVYRGPYHPIRGLELAVRDVSVQDGSEGYVI